MRKQHTPDAMTNPAIVDELGGLAALVADLTSRQQDLKAELIKRAGLTPEDDAHTVEGKLFQATVSCYEQDNLDMKAVRAKLSAQFIKAHTTTTTCNSVRVVARTRDKLTEAMHKGPRAA